MNFKYSTAPPEIIPLPGTNALLLHFASDNPGCVKAVLVISSSSALVDSNIDQRQIDLEDFCKNFEEDLQDKDRRIKEENKNKLSAFRDLNKKVENEKGNEEVKNPIVPYSVFYLYFPSLLNQSDVIWSIDNAIKAVVANYNIVCIITRRVLMTEVQSVLRKQNRDSLLCVYTWPATEVDHVDSDPVLPYTKFVYEDKTLKEQIDEVKSFLGPDQSP